MSSHQKTICPQKSPKSEASVEVCAGTINSSQNILKEGPKFRNFRRIASDLDI